MIPMSCPSCGRKGNVPLDRLNTRMHCKKCDAIFHLDPSGKPVLGEPPAAKGSKGAKGARNKNEPLDPIGILASKLVKTPKPIWMGLAGMLGLYVAYLAFTMLGPAPRTAEGEFQQRNVAAAIAFLERDAATLQNMATQDSREEIVKLIEEFRPLVGDAKGKGSENMPPNAAPPETMTEQPVVHVSIQPPAPVGEEKAPPIFTLDLGWIKGGTRYFLNGRATLEANQERVKAVKEAAAELEAKKKKKSK